MAQSGIISAKSSSRDAAAVERARRMGRRRRSWHQVFVYATLSAGALVFLIPLAWMVSTSLKPEDQLYVFPPIWIPRTLQWSNYAKVWESVPWWVYTRNSVFLTAVNIIGNLLGSSLAAFSLARLRYPGRTLFFLIMLSTMMVPYWVTIIPTFILFRTLKWTNTYLPLIVPAYFAVPFYTFLMRQYFMGISRELEDAARLDGASTFRIYAQLVMPLARPALATVAIFSFVRQWNDLINPLIYINDQSKYTIAVGLAGFQNNYRVFMNHMMAAATMALLPVLIVYFIFQRLFIQGIVMSVSKG